MCESSRTWWMRIPRLFLHGERAVTARFPWMKHGGQSSEADYWALTRWVGCKCKATTLRWRMQTGATYEDSNRASNVWHRGTDRPKLGETSWPKNNTHCVCHVNAMLAPKWLGKKIRYTTQPSTVSDVHGVVPQEVFIVWLQVHTVWRGVEHQQQNFTEDL